MAKSGKMTVQAASRIYSATAKNGNGSVGKNTFGARVMSTAMRQAGASPAPAGAKATDGGNNK